MSGRSVSDGGREPAPQPKGVHLVGSVPFENAEAVFRAVGESLSGHVRRVPDGETGKRARWNSWTAPTYEQTPGLEVQPPPPGNYTPWGQVRLVVAPEELVLGPLGFAEAARASYTVFAALKAGGHLPSDCRFQVCIPSPIAPMMILVEDGSRAGVEGAHLRRLASEIAEITAHVPADELAIQFDACQDVGIWEGFYEPYFADRKAGVIERLEWCAAQVPAPVELGFHLCYGDFGHRHFLQPEDTTVVTEMANRLTSAIDRPINWIHVPVPIERDDEAYFAPLADLVLRPPTELYLGLIHYDDGVAGAQARIRAAQSVRAEFGIATECGFGRRPPETIPALLALHAELAAPVR